MTSPYLIPPFRICFNDPVIHRAVLAFVLTSLLAPCLSVPIAKRSPSHRHHGAGHPEDLWWKNPCGPLAEHHRHKHHAGKDIPLATKLAPMKREIKTFNDFYRRQIRIIEEYYKSRNCIQLSGEQYEYGWLPKKPKLRSFDIHNKDSREKALLQFHKDIQIFAVALYQMKMGDIKEHASTGDHNKNRNKIFDSISMKMKSFMCEVETFLNETVPHFKAERIPKDYLEDKDWSTSTAVTIMCAQDRGVLMAWKNNMKGWITVIRKVVIRNEKGGHHIHQQSSSDEDV